MHLFVDDYTSKVCHTCQSTIMLCSKTPNYSNSYKRLQEKKRAKHSQNKLKANGEEACETILCTFKEYEGKKPLHPVKRCIQQVSDTVDG